LASKDLRKVVYPERVPQNLTEDPLAASMLRVMIKEVNSSGTNIGLQDERYFVKSKVANLFILMPSEIYYGRVKIKGKVHKKCFDTTSFEVAKKKLKGWLEEMRGRPVNDATLGALAEEYAKRLQLQVDNRQFLLIAIHLTTQSLNQGQCVRLIGFGTLVKFIPVLRTNDQIMNAHCFELPMQAVAERSGFVATVDFFSQFQLFLAQSRKPSGENF
jgi:hypothetical protein